MTLINLETGKVELVGRSLSPTVIKAAHLVKIAHEGQFRKDGKTPFATHPYAVADLVYEIYGESKVHTESKDLDVLLIASYAHDTVEDVKDFDIDEFIEEVYDHRAFHTKEQEHVKEIVLALTKNDTIPSRHQKDVDSYERICIVGNDAIKIKLCDRIHNISDMNGMTDGHKRRYIAETYFMLGYFANARTPAYVELLNATLKRANELYK